MILVVNGKNIYNFIYKMHRLNIDLLDIKYISDSKIKVKIIYADLKKVLDNKTIYEISCIKKEGLIRLKEVIFKYKYIISFIIISFSIIYFLSNLIFYVDIVTNDKKMKDKIRKYLNSEGISKYHFKKSYNDIKQIKNNILNKYKDEIDWIEIENIGTKYIVRYEPRLITKTKKNNNYQHIIAKKNAVIYKMDVKKGQIVKSRNNYVKKGDIIVSGYIYLNDKINDTVRSEGRVFGETWYKVNVKYPLNYKRVVKTNNKTKVITLKFLNHQISLFDFNRYKDYEYKDTVLLFNNILPISINLREKRKINVYEENNNYKQAIKKATKYAYDTILKKIGKGYIKEYTILKNNKVKDNVDVTIFFSVIENITDYQEIDEYRDIGNTNE